MKAATTNPPPVSLLSCISIHAAREGGDFHASASRPTPPKFQSTPPVKAATLCRRVTVGYDLFQSTPPVKAATQDGYRSNTAQAISIHAAREGGDTPKTTQSLSSGRFQSTPPVKAATLQGESMDAIAGFQSTPPVKAATFDGQPLELVCGISIHAAREGGDVIAAAFASVLVISIHAAREGGDENCDHFLHSL